MDLDYYSLLRISKEATHFEIQAAYRLEMARRPQGWWERFCLALAGRTPQRLTEAYRTLSRPEARAEYDKYLTEASHWPYGFPQ